MWYKIAGTNFFCFVIFHTFDRRMAGHGLTVRCITCSRAVKTDELLKSKMLTTSIKSVRKVRETMVGRICWKVKVLSLEWKREGVMHSEVMMMMVMMMMNECKTRWRWQELIITVWRSSLVRQKSQRKDYFCDKLQSVVTRLIWVGLLCYNWVAWLI